MSPIVATFHCPALRKLCATVRYAVQWPATRIMGTLGSRPLHVVNGRAVLAASATTATATCGRKRARTISIKRLSKRLMERDRALYPSEVHDRPATRADCEQGEDAARPCPFVSCKHHLYLDVSERTGSVKLNFPDLEVWETAESCTLDIADRGGMILDEVGTIMNLTRERIRQLEARAVAKLKAALDTEGFSFDDLEPAASMAAAVYPSSVGKEGFSNNTLRAAMERLGIKVPLPRSEVVRREKLLRRVLAEDLPRAPS